jgi:hypothetical protein
LSDYVTHTYTVASYNAYDTSKQSAGDTGYQNGAPTSAYATLALSDGTTASASPVISDPNTNPADAFTLAITSQPATGQGTASVSGGNLIYTPPSGNTFSGTTSFNFTATDKGGATVTGTATVTVCGVPTVNTPSVALTDPYTGGTASVTIPVQNACQNALNGSIAIKNADGSKVASQTFSNLTGSATPSLAFGELPSLGAYTAEATFTNANGQSTTVSVPFTAACAAPSMSGATASITGTSASLKTATCNGPVNGTVTVTKTSGTPVTNPVATAALSGANSPFGANYTATVPGNMLAGSYNAALSVTDVWGQSATANAPFTIDCPTNETIALTSNDTTPAVLPFAYHGNYTSIDVCQGALNASMVINDNGGTQVAVGTTSSSFVSGSGTSPFDFTTPELAPGTYSAILKLTDGNGYTATSTYPFNVACPTPVFMGMDMSKDFTSLVGLVKMYSCSDPVNTPVTVSLSAGGIQGSSGNVALQATSVPRLYTFSYGLSGITDGSYSFTASLTDAMSHTASTSNSLVVDWNGGAAPVFTYRGSQINNGSVTVNSFGGIGVR